MFDAADIRVSGDWPWDVQVHDSACWGQVPGRGSLGLGDTYVGGQSDRAALDQFFTRLLLVEADGRLAQAQEHKLLLEPGIRVLVIVCGWGGLPMRFELCDYRQLEALHLPRFDRVVAVSMDEHVGPRNARTFSKAVSRALRDDGLVLLHTIGYRVTTRRTDPWTDEHIVPHGRLPYPRSRQRLRARLRHHADGLAPQCGAVLAVGAQSGPGGGRRAARLPIAVVWVMPSERRPRSGPAASCRPQP